MTTSDLAHKQPSERVHRLSGWVSEFLLRYGTLVAIGILLVYFSIVNEYFLSVSNFLDILRSVSILAIVALGVTLSVVVGGFDTSVGAVTGLAVILSSALMIILNLPWYLAIAIAYLVGALVGLLNSWLIVKLRIPDLLATLGVLYLISGLQLSFTKGNAVYKGMTNPWSAERATAPGEFAEAFKQIGQGYIFATDQFNGIPIPVVLMLLVAIVVYLFLNYTRYGRILYAVGGNSEAARLAGVPVGRYRTLAYVLSALLATTGGIVLASRIGQGAIRAGDPYLLDGVSATYFGFAVLAARRPNVFGTILGAVFVGVMLNGLTMMNMPWYLQDLVKGIVLIVALGVSFALSRRG